MKPCVLLMLPSVYIHKNLLMITIQPSEQAWCKLSPSIDFDYLKLSDITSDVGIGYKWEENII
jgi:hypothetical protein